MNPTSQNIACGLLVGQTAIITGTGQGLGQAIALEFAAEGATVALFEWNKITLNVTQKAIEAHHALFTTGVEPRVLTFELDITDYSKVGQALETTATQTGRIDILVNNAGIFHNASILEDTPEAWREVIAVNLETVYMTSKLVAPHMAAQANGRIIQIASVAGMVSRGNVGSYNASKGGGIALTKSMAVELAPYNIAVNAIAPGFMRTAMMQTDNGTDLTTVADFQTLYVQKRRIPLARAGEPRAVAGADVFLASDYCRYMTGQVLVVDGGLISTF